MGTLHLLADGLSSSSEVTSAVSESSSYISGQVSEKTGNGFVNWWIDLWNSIVEIATTGKSSGASTSSSIFGRIIVAIVVFIVLYYFNKFLIWLMRKIAKVSNKKASNSANTAKSFVISAVKVLLWVILIVIIASILGFDLSGLSTIISSGVVALGLALQDIIGNFASGIIILTTKNIMVGDYVAVNGVEGTVKEISILNTKLVTPDNVMYCVPNSQFTANSFSNTNVMKVRRINLTVGVSYNADINDVKKIIRYCIDQNPNVQHDMPVTVAISNFADSEIDFTARCYVPGPVYWDVRFSLSQAIYEEFLKRNVSIPYPQMDIHLDTWNDKEKTDYKINMTGLKNYSTAPVENPKPTNLDRNDVSDPAEQALDKMFAKNEKAYEERKKKRATKKAAKARKASSEKKTGSKESE